jgi:exonuclease SbcC
MKFAHLADTHIRNLKYHKEYKEVFQKLYEQLKKEKVDCIIHCGDIAHTKTQISPEFVEMCSDFLFNLAEIAPTYVILGNHDGNLKNSSRQDALSPIAAALKHPNLTLLKNSGETKINDKFTVNVLSVFDRENWQLPTNREKVNIALYHGAVSGVKTDTGWTMESGEDDINIFNNFDYGFLGDIHKTNQALDADGKIRYPGSTVQQNHGETNDKGFLLWDIVDKESYTCAHHILENPKPFITVKLSPKGRLPNKLKVQKNARLRLVTENNLPLDVVRRAIDVAKHRYSPESVTFLNRAHGARKDLQESTSALRKEDLRDPAVQEKLIAEYLEDFHPSDEILKDIFSSNSSYNSKAEQQEDVQRNVNWKLLKLEWDNLFNYGDGNTIDFTEKAGIVGILGKNFSGKSSIIDSLLYALYNTTSKRNRKNLNLINQNKDNSRGYVEVGIGNKTYFVERTSTKYTKKLKGKQTLEAKTDVNFWLVDQATGEERSLNGITRAETDKNIRKVFGTLEDFLTTSMASQLDSLSYINEGSTRRKEILAKFLDLEFFDKKFKLIKDDSVDTKAVVKRFSEIDYDNEIKEARTTLARAMTELSVNQRELEEHESTKENLAVQLSGINNKLQQIPSEVVKNSSLESDLISVENTIAALEINASDAQQKLDSCTIVYDKLDNFIDSFDIDDWKGRNQNIEEMNDRLQKVQRDLQEYETLNSSNQSKIELLKKAPCGTALKQECHFVKDAYAAYQDVSRTRIAVNQLSLNKKTLISKLRESQPEKVIQYIEQYELLLEKKRQKTVDVANLKLDLQKSKSKLLELRAFKEEINVKLQEQKENLDLIKELKVLEKEKLKLEGQATSALASYESQKKFVLELYKKNGSSEQHLEELLEQKAQFETMEKEFATLDLLMRCMHPNGISYDIIKKRLPVINAEVSKILTNIVDFEIFFENDENRLNILIQHPGYDPRPIEMGSGAEKTISAMAIRLALLNVSTLPKGDIFILDEPGTALDEDNMEGFIRILDMIKTQFKTVLLISHLDTLKDIVDQQVIIEKKNGYASIQE